MHATSPTISQPRTGGLRSFGAGLLVSAAVIGGIIVAANVQPIAPSGTANRTDIHSPAWIQAHRSAPAAGAVQIGEQTQAERIRDLWKAYAERRRLESGNVPAGLSGGAKSSVPNTESYRNSVTPQSESLAVTDPMAYWNSLMLRRELAPTVDASAGYIPSLVSGVVPPSVRGQLVGPKVGGLGAPGAVKALEQTPAESTLDYWRSYADQRTAPAPYIPELITGAAAAPNVLDAMAYWHSVTFRTPFTPATVYSGKTIDPKLVSQGLDHPVLSTDHGKVLIGKRVAGNDTQVGISHR